jgi:hypothetical protein
MFEGGNGGGMIFRHGDPTCTVESIAPVSVAEPGYHDRAGTAARGMHETVIAQINADVRERVVEGVEENQVARLEISPIERLRGFTDRPAVARQPDSGDLLEDVIDKAAAVEPGVGRVAPPDDRDCPPG